MVRVIELETPHDTCFSGERAKVVPYHRMYGKQYCLPAFVYYPSEIVAELQEASEAIDRIFWKTMRFVQRYLEDDWLVQKLALDPRLLSLMRMEVPMHAIARQDWIVSGGRIKLIEYNTDTPTGVPEAAWLAGDLLREWNSRPQHSANQCLHNPSQLMEQRIRGALMNLLHLYRDAGYNGPIYFSCDDSHIEDRTNTLYIMQLLQDEGVDTCYAPLSDIRIVPDEGLFFQNRRIEILYRLYPLEYVLDERDSEGYPIGEALLRLIESGELAVINPAQSLITQSKGMLALIWSLFKRNQWMMKMNRLRAPLFDDADCAAIERWMLPADWSSTIFEEAKVPFVSKSFFGREGKGTIIHENERMIRQPIAEADVDTYYHGQAKLYQQYESMLPLSVATESGPFDGYLLTGVYVIGRKFAGILPRVGDRITGDLAYFCAAATNDKK